MNLGVHSFHVPECTKEVAIGIMSTKEQTFQNGNENHRGDSTRTIG